MRSIKEEFQKPWVVANSRHQVCFFNKQTDLSCRLSPFDEISLDPGVNAKS